MKDLTKGRISFQILLFSLPMLLGNVFQQLYNVADSVIVGNFLGKHALAAVGASFPIIFVLTSLFMGISIGISVLISQFFGAKDFSKLKKAIDVMLIFNFLAGILMSIVGYTCAGLIFQALKLPSEIFNDAVLYFQIYSTGLIFFFLYIGISSVLRGLGDSKTPLYFLIFSTLLNIALDLLFVVSFKWGIPGVAWATVFSQVITLIGIIIYLQLKHSLIKFNLKHLTFDFLIFRKSINIGLPTGIQQTFVSLGMMALLRFVNDFGTDAVAAYAIATRLDSFAMMPAMNFSAALTTFVGQNLGAKIISRVSKGLYATLIMSASISALVTLVFWFFGQSLLKIFTQDLIVIEIAYSYLKIVGSFYIIFSSMFIIHGFFRGAGDTFIPMLITVFSLWILRIPASYLLSRESMGIGYKGNWFGIPIAWIFGMCATYIYFLKANWKKKVVIN